MVDLTDISDVPTRIHDKATHFFHDFRSFILKQNIFALALAVVIGTAANNVVQALIADVVMPVVNLIIPDQEWAAWGPVISAYTQAKPRVDANGIPQLDAHHQPIIDKIQVPNRLLLGHLLWQGFNLVVIGLIAYFATKYLLRQPIADPAGPPTRPCPFCLETIPIAAKVCRACTRDLPPASCATSAAPSAAPCPSPP